MSLNVELQQSDDSYKVIGISTAHLTPFDLSMLAKVVGERSSNMITQRDTGFFVKLYGTEVDSGLPYGPLSDSFYQLVSQVQAAGFGMIEFDADATQYDSLATYEHEQAQLA